MAEQNTSLKFIPLGVFKAFTLLIIEKIEGGYYNPSMGDKKMGDSGETMLGIDRKKGTDIRKRSPKAWDEFFSILDKSNASTRWKRYSFGPTTDPNYSTRKQRLLELATEIMYSEFNYYSKNYFQDNSEINVAEIYNKVVTKNPNLLAHMIYATWNGEGWFKKFARYLIKEYKNGDTDGNSLALKGVNLRMNEGLNPGSSPIGVIKKSGKTLKEEIFPLLSKNPVILKTPQEINLELVQAKQNKLAKKLNSEFLKNITATRSTTDVKIDIPKYVSGL